MRIHSVKQEEIKKIVIIGAGGTSRDILDTIHDINLANNKPIFKCVGFLDDDNQLLGKNILGAKVLGPIKKYSKYLDCWFVCGIGHVKNLFIKPKLIEQVKVPIDQFATIIHPTAHLSRTAQVGHGAVLLKGVTIMSNVTIGDHVVIHPQAVISHDVSLGDYTFVANGVSVGGAVKVGINCYLGSNSSIKEYLTINDYSVIGMGSVVLKNVPSESIYVGNPAKLLRKSRP